MPEQTGSESEAFKMRFAVFQNVSQVRNAWKPSLSASDARVILGGGTHGPVHWTREGHVAWRGLRNRPYLEVWRLFPGPNELPLSVREQVLKPLPWVRPYE